MAVISVAGTELYSTSKSYSLTGLAGQVAVIDITADECVVRDLVIVTVDDSQQGVDCNTQDKCSLSEVTVKMPNTSTATAVYVDGSYNRVLSLLADSDGGAITGVTLGGTSSDNLVSGVVVT